MGEISRCMIVDDEPVAHYVLSSYIEKNYNLVLVAQCYNAPEALNFLREHTVDLLFLDIDMPEINELEFLQLLANPPKTILTTAYSEYALESYEYGVLDYLLKPISSTRFLKSIERFLSVSKPLELEEPEYLVTKIDGRIVEIALDEIDYIQSHGNYVKIYTATRAYMTAMTTQEILTHIPAGRFMRIHKSYIAAVLKITRMDGGYVTVAGKELPVGITFKRELGEKLAGWL